MLSIKTRKKLWNKFYDLRTPVNRLIIPDHREGIIPAPMLYWENTEKRIEWSLSRYERQMKDIEVLDDHIIPSLTMITGTEIFAEAFGCKVAKPLNSNPCALPMVFSAEEAAKIKVPRLEDTKFMLLFDMARKLREKAGKEALLSLPDIQTPADVAALIWEKSDFYPSLYEEPEAVKELIEKVRSFMFDFFDKWFAEFGNECMAHYPDYYVPGGVTMSEDEIGSINSDMYKEFFEDDITMMCERYGSIGIHCCADSIHQWENLKRIPNLKLINLHLTPEETEKSFKVFGNVCAMLPIPRSAMDIDKCEGADKYHICHAGLYPQTLDDAKRLVDDFYTKYPHIWEIANNLEKEE